MKHSRAFTMLELLCALGILGVLAALLLPALFTARDKGVQTVCLAHGRELGLALALYVDDWDAYPGAGWADRPYRGDWVWIGPPLTPGGRHQLRLDWGSLWSYVRSPALYRCPARPEPLAYALNAHLDGRGAGGLTQPATTVAFAEEDSESVFGRGPNDGVLVPEYDWDWLTRRHQGFGHVIFADGHARAWRRERLTPAMFWP